MVIKTQKQIRSENNSVLSFLKKREKINISDRIKYYNIISKYINKITDSKNCFTIYKDNYQIKYKIGDKIILDKKIGDDSRNGIVFLSHFKTSSYNSLDKYLTFATKLTDFRRTSNIREYNILEYLTQLNIDEVCPNFPIGYGKLVCTTSEIMEFEKVLSLNLRQEKRHILGSKLYDKDHIFIFNEIADGSLKQFKYNRNLTSINIKINALEQCILSIMFFNKYINAYHNDCHYGNFLYHLIKPGGYFHYNIYGTDYYIENIGYLWVIWDYGLTVPYYNSYKINGNKFGTYENKLLAITTDYYKLLHSMILIFGSDNYLTIMLNNLIRQYNNITSVDNMKDFTIQILNILVQYSNTIKTHINSKNKIINKKPYIIN